VRIAQYDRNGPPEVLELVEAATPESGPGELVLEIRAAGINPFDVKQRAGAYGPVRGVQRTGLDGAGVVAAVGAETDGFAVGDRVVTSGALGTAATHLLVRPGHLTPIPDGVDFDRAAAIGVPFGTAYQSLRSLGVGPGDVLLVHGGSGAVGQAAIQIGRALGAARIIATGGAGSLERIAALGAEPVDYAEDVPARVLELGPVTVVLDAAGTDDAFATVELLADRSRWATIVAGPRADALGLAAYSGGSAVPMTSEQHALRREGIREALRMLAEDALDVEIASVHPLDDIVAAHRAVETHAARGKVLLRP